MSEVLVDETPVAAARPAASRWDRVRGPLRRGPLRTVAEVLVVLVCAAEVVAWQEVAADSYFVVAALAVLAVAVRHRWPVLAALVAGPAFGWTALLLAPLVLLFTAGHRERRDAVVVALVGWTVLSSAVLIAQAELGLQPSSGVVLRLLTDVAASAAMAAGAAGLGRLLRTRREQAAAMGELVAGRARERALAEHAARAEERAHLAREMHDVVASQVTLIAVQAAGLRMTPGVDDRTRQVAETIRAAAAQTTRELREVLAALRVPEDGAAPTGAPAGPCLAELGRLWESSGCTGRLVVQVPDGVVVAAEVQHAVYRVLQEGLTNAVRHAPGAEVRAGVEVVASTVVVSVVNRPGPGAGPAAGSATTAGPPAVSDLSTGNGLAGVAERAEALGGHARWATADDGGHELIAVLPLLGRPRA